MNPKDFLQPLRRLGRITAVRAALRPFTRFLLPSMGFANTPTAATARQTKLAAEQVPHQVARRGAVDSNRLAATCRTGPGLVAVLPPRSQETRSPFCRSDQQGCIPRNDTGGCCRRVYIMGPFLSCIAHCGTMTSIPSNLFPPHGWKVRGLDRRNAQGVKHRLCADLREHGKFRGG